MIGDNIKLYLTKPEVKGMSISEYNKRIKYLGEGTGVFNTGNKEVKVIKLDGKTVASGYTTEPNKVYFSIADNYEDFNGSGSDSLTCNPKTQEQFIEITNELERQGITNDDYDNYYSPGCTITVIGNMYYTR